MKDKVSCIIVDDEPLAIQALQMLLQKIDAIEVKATCQNSFEAFNCLKDKQIDLMFLDINMPEMSGLELLQSLTHHPAVIMTTAHREYAVEAFDLEVFDYLLKPISMERLMKAISRFVDRMSINGRKSMAQSFEDKADEYLFVRADRRLRKIEFKDIIYIEALKDYVRIHTTEGSVITRMTMKETIGKLPSETFTRVHRSYIVNTGKITAITRYDIELGDREIPIGDSYKETVGKMIIPPGE
jgi:DNA-binding LytR/AlgR family response regulator